MYLLRVFALLGTAWTVDSEVHSLNYIYTALSKPVGLPGIHEFTAMGLLDDKIIDYYDSEIRKKVPKQRWMEERMDKDYWEKGTRSRYSKEEWFRVNIAILMDRMRQNSTDQVHVLQWVHGCEVKDGEFSRATDRYSYDGEDFLSFDNEHKVWVAPTPEGSSTKAKWDKVQALNDYTRNYLNKECVEWLDRFNTYGKKQLFKARKPEIYTLKKPSGRGDTFILTCFATGFYPKDIEMKIWRNERVLDKADGVTSLGVLPNEDDTFQLKMKVEILQSDESQYRCEVIHKATDVFITQDEWKLEDNGNGLVGVIVGSLLGLLALVAVGVAGWFGYRKWSRENKSPAGSPDSASTDCGVISTTEPLNRGSPDSASTDFGPQGTPLLGSSDSVSTDSGKGSDEHIATAPQAGMMNGAASNGLPGSSASSTSSGSASDDSGKGSDGRISTAPQGTQKTPLLGGLNGEASNGLENQGENAA